MLSLFKSYKEAGKVNEALLVGRNMVNKQPGNSELVSEYVEYLLYLTEMLPSIEDKKSFLQQASVTMSFYEENVDLNNETLKIIFDLRNKIAELEKNINSLETAANKKMLNKIRSSNNDRIRELYLLKASLKKSKEKDSFNKALNKISKIDSKIDHDYLTDEQGNNYNQLNKEFTDIISQKMRKFEHDENITYNQRAVSAYEEAYQKFKNYTSLYKDQTALYNLVSKTLFAYDAGRLFNQTLIYYNHVYSYIFNALDDSGKYALTKYSIDCERKLG